MVLRPGSDLAEEYKDVKHFPIWDKWERSHKEGIDTSDPNGTASIRLKFLCPARIFISVGNKTFVPKCKNTNGGRIVRNATCKGKFAPQTFRERILRAARSEKSSLQQYGYYPVNPRPRTDLNLTVAAEREQEGKHVIGPQKQPRAAIGPEHCTQL